MATLIHPKLWNKEWKINSKCLHYFVKEQKHRAVTGVSNLLLYILIHTHTHTIQTQRIRHMLSNKSSRGYVIPLKAAASSILRSSVSEWQW